MEGGLGEFLWKEEKLQMSWFLEIHLFQILIELSWSNGILCQGIKTSNEHITTEGFELIDEGGFHRIELIN